MRATVTAVLISAGVLCAQEPKVREAVPSTPAGTGSGVADYEEFLVSHPLLVFLLKSRSFFRNEAELDVKIPAARKGEESRRPVGEVILDLKRDGSVAMNRRAVNAEELKDALAKFAKSNPDQAVVLRGDQDVDYKYIVDALDVCRAANIWNVAFATSKPE